MSQTIPIIATFFNFLVASLSFLILGWNSIAAHAAARNTARVGLLLFILAFAQPELARFVTKLPSAIYLVHGFVGAMMVHFAVVAVTIAIDHNHHLRKLDLGAILIIVLGSTIVFASGLTAAGKSRLARITHNVLLFFILGIFTAAYFAYPTKAMRAFAVLLMISLILRIVAYLQQWRSQHHAAAIAT